LTKVLNYEIRGEHNLPLLNDKLRSAQGRDLQDSSNITGSGQEASMISTEMRRELVQQMVLRLEQMTARNNSMPSCSNWLTPKLKAEAQAHRKLRVRLQDAIPQAVAPRSP
jgi:LPS-assembly lipoprotein